METPVIRTAAQYSILKVCRRLTEAKGPSIFFTQSSNSFPGSSPTRFLTLSPWGRVGDYPWNEVTCRFDEFSKKRLV